MAAHGEPGDTPADHAGRLTPTKPATAALLASSPRDSHPDRRHVVELEASPPDSRAPRPRAVTSEDQQLIDECLAGRTEAFGQLVARHQHRLYNTLVKILGSPDDAQEVAQDAFVHAFEKLGTFRGKSAFYSWLFRIAYNCAISRKRKAKHPAASIDALREQSGHEPRDAHPANRPAHQLELTELQGQVRAALAELSEDFRTVIVLKEIENLSYEEIAQIVGCPLGTVRSRIHRARALLLESLRGTLAKDDGA